MRWTKGLALSLSVAYLCAGPALAADVYIYPEKGQSQEQQQKDEYECYNWGKQQTGFDPMARPTATSPPPEQTSHGALGGAARGAAVGAVGGAIAGDAGKGAAVGAAAGGMVGGRIGDGNRSGSSSRRLSTTRAALSTTAPTVRASPVAATR